MTAGGEDGAPEKRIKVKKEGKQEAKEAESEKRKESGKENTGGKDALKVNVQGNKRI